MAPEVATPGIGDIPAQDRMIWIAGVVVAGVDLQAMAVRVAQVDVEGVGYPVPSGTSLDVALLAQGPEEVAHPEHVMRLVREDPEVMEARPGAAGEGHVVHGLLAVHPGGVQSLGVLDRFRQAEAERPVVLIGGLHVGYSAVEMSRPGHLGAAAQVVALLEPVGLRRVMKELDGKAQRVLGPDGGGDAGGGPRGHAYRPAPEAAVGLR